MHKKKALITGITGQDGAYLADFLIKKGYEVHGIKRRASSFNTGRIEHLYEDPHSPNAKLYLHYGDLTDSLNVTKILQEIKPDEVYNLAAQSHVRISFEIPDYTADVVGLGTLRLLEAIKFLGLNKKTKFYQASSSELFGNTKSIPQTELTPFQPQSPYAVAKLFAYWTAKNYRDGYDIFASNGILFNHESPIRGENFVTRKVTRHVANLVKGNFEVLYLGNLDVKRDWGHAKDYIKGMWLIMQHEKPDDFVLATGKHYSVRQLAEFCFSYAGVEIIWEGEGLDEIGLDKKTGKLMISIDDRYYRPTEVENLLGDPSKANKVLGWKAEIGFEDMLTEMIETDINEF